MNKLATNNFKIVIVLKANSDKELYLYKYVIPTDEEFNTAKVSGYDLFDKTQVGVINYNIKDKEKIIELKKFYKLLDNKDIYHDASQLQEQGKIKGSNLGYSNLVHLMAIVSISKKKQDIIEPYD